jgi:alkylhydroperoxidase/carboxymuconolactone decarboxylase family protein YurZ
MPDTTLNTPVLDTIAELTAVSVNRSGLDPDELLLARIAALVAMGAGPMSYLVHVGPAAEVGVTVDRVEDLLIAVAPIVGTARVTSAAENIAEALGLVVAVAEELSSE